MSNELALQAKEIWDQKVKPQLALGRLEELAINIVTIRGELYPQLTKPKVILYAADHGIYEQNVSSSPQEITYQQVENFANGGGAISLLCKKNGIDLEIVDVGVKHTFSNNLPILNRKIGWGTKDFLNEDAMTFLELGKALEIGKERVIEALKEGRTTLILGEMGIANTASASALMATLCHLPVEECTGRGAGLSDSALEHKIAIIKKALSKHDYPKEPLEALQKVGGFEIAAITGSMLEASKHSFVILVDGFITTVSALIASLIEPNVLKNTIFCHESDEKGHTALLKYLRAEPILKLAMRLGEGSGAAVCYPLIEQSLNLYLEMESFEKAEVTNSVRLLKQKGVDLRK
jgi:nicotinate-nucleotide--dimethylbenzimidazole phosphoribosyltransferase